MTRSVWKATADDVRFPALVGELRADVVIIGGGITGITTALLLNKGGVSVALLEAGRLGTGTTGDSTGNLYAPVDWHLFALEDKWGKEAMQAVAHSRQDAVDLIEQTVRTYELDCDFARRPFCLYAESAAKDEIERVEREYRAAVDAHLNARVVDRVPLPFRVEKALVIEGQAQFHPLNYVRALAGRIVSDGCRIFEHSQVTRIDDNAGVVTTETGQVRADRIVMATHTPKGVCAVHTAMKVFQEHGIGLRLSDDVYPRGIFWSAGSTHSLRTVERKGERFLIVVGEKHPTGQVEHGERCIDALEHYARKRFPVRSRHHAWTGQHYRSADELPYIGRSPGTGRTYIATGFATDGLTYGALAAMIISEDIFGCENKWSDLYDAGRVTPAESAGVVQEDVSAGTRLVRDYLHRYPDQLDQVPRGAGRLLEIEGRKLAVYRDEGDRFALTSPVCTHMGCLVHWNALERSWDCPCHGSRFTVQGDVIEGPALGPLERYDVPTK